MKRSIGVFAQDPSFTVGAAGFCRGWNDQNFRCSGLMLNLGDATAATTGLASESGHTAPVWIQYLRSAISLSFNFAPPRGIFRFGSTCITARIRRLSSGFPTVIAAPD